jgi:hypothetical protein
VFDPLSNAMLGGPMIILENFDFWEETDIRKANVFNSTCIAHFSKACKVLLVVEKRHVYTVTDEHVIIFQLTLRLSYYNEKYNDLLQNVRHYRRNFVILGCHAR